MPKSGSRFQGGIQAEGRKVETVLKGWVQNRPTGAETPVQSQEHQTYETSPISAPMSKSTPGIQQALQKVYCKV